MSYARPLRKILEDKDAELYGRLINIEKIARSLLTYTVGKFPYYTPHDFLHSENVEDNLNWIITDEVKEKINAHEIFFLLVAAWMHDWGMIGKPDEDPRKIREVHHLRTEQYFQKLHSEVLLSKHEGEIVGRICKGHRELDLFDKEFDDIPFRQNIRVHMRFLTAALRFADECDVTESRTPEIIYYTLNPTEKAEEEFKKHLNVIGIGPHEIHKHRIELVGTAWDPKGVQTLQEVRERIQNELDRVKGILATEQGIVLDYVDLRVIAKGFINEPISFSVDQKRITELLMGKHLYSRKDVAIRELLQNAIDACKMAKFLEPACSPDITFHKDDKMLTVDDTGVGMDFGTAKKYLSVIGASLYTSEEFKKIREKAAFDPISRFGIGILSCFLVASQITIETKLKDKRACRFSIRDLGEGWRYEESARSKPGTKIILVLNDEGKKMNLEESLLHYAKAVEFPIFLEIKEGVRVPFVPKWDHDMKEAETTMRPPLFLPHEKLPQVCNHFSKVTDDFSTDIYLYDRQFSWSGGERQFLSMMGVYIGATSLVPELSQRLLVLVNLEKDSVDLAVSRERIVENEKTKLLSRKYRETVFDFVKTHFEKGTSGKNLSEFAEAGEFQVIAGDFFDHLTITNKKDEEALMSFLVKERTYPVIDRDGLRFSLLDDVVLNKRVEKIYEYRFTGREMEVAESEIRLITPLLQKTLKKKEVVVVTFCPIRIQKIDAGRTNISTLSYSSILAYMCSSNPLRHERFSSNLIAPRLESRKVKTPLDSLLPQYCSFVEFPVEFRGVTVQTKPYVLKKKEPQTKYIQVWIAELVEFMYFPEFGTRQVGYKDFIVSIPDFKKAMISGPEYAIDVNEPLVSLMLKHADTILANKTLEELVNLHLRLSLVMKSGGTHGRGSAYDLTQRLVEGMIIRSIKEEQAYKHLKEHLGQLPLILMRRLGPAEFEVRPK